MGVMSDPHDDDPPADENTGLPRWVTAAGIVGVVVAVLVILTAIVGGGHGPGRHDPDEAPGAPTPAIGESHTVPSGGHR
jgi:hypothetical protein